MNFIITLITIASLAYSPEDTTTKAANITNEINEEILDSTVTGNTIIASDVNNIITELNAPSKKGAALVNVSPDIINVLNKQFNTSKVAEGFRIQIYSSNRGPIARQKAFEIEKTIKEIDHEMNVYVSYESPFWKVRLGNCLNRDEASEFRRYVIEKFPDFAAETYIVPSEIETN